ncbi:hypothetical protein ACFSUK_04940 [Sphingobium scionense]
MRSIFEIRPRLASVHIRDLNQTSQRGRSALPRFSKQPLSFTKITDQSVNIDEAYSEFMLKFFVALVVVILISLLSLGWRVGIVVAA